MSTTGIAEQRQMAMHDLLDRLLVSRAEEPEAYRRVALHESYLKGWFWERPQWRLLTGRGVYRLERMPSMAMAGRGLPRLRSPMAYAALCWVLWFAESMATSARDWFVISELAQRISTVAEGRFSLSQRAHREALVQALQFLVEVGGLLHRDGDADRWVAAQTSDGADAEVIYEFAESAPRLLANFTYSGLARLEGGDPRARTATQTGEEAPPLARAWRALLLGPLFWRGDDPEAFDALTEAVDRVHQDLEVALGWQLECTDTYARIWRSTTARNAGSVLLDLYPDPGTQTEERHIRYLHHPILLLLDRCQAEAAAGRWQADAEGALSVSYGDLYDALAALRAEYRRNWGAELGAMGLEELVEAVLAEMRRMGLLQGPDAYQRCYLLPIAAQVRGHYVTPSSRSEGASRGEDGKEEPDRPQQSTLF